MLYWSSHPRTPHHPIPSSPPPPDLIPSTSDSHRRRHSCETCPMTPLNPNPNLNPNLNLNLNLNPNPNPNPNLNPLPCTTASSQKSSPSRSSRLPSCLKDPSPSASIRGSSSSLPHSIRVHPCPSVVHLLPCLKDPCSSVVLFPTLPSRALNPLTTHLPPLFLTSALRPLTSKGDPNTASPRPGNSAAPDNPPPAPAHTPAPPAPSRPRPPCPPYTSAPRTPWCDHAAPG